MGVVWWGSEEKTGPAMVGSVPLIKNLLLLDAEGRRIAVKYYSEEWCVESSTWERVWNMPLDAGRERAGGVQLSRVTSTSRPTFGDRG